MTLDVQKASMWKRISAWLFDGILLIIIAVLFATILSYVLNFDNCSQQLDAYYAKYEAEYGVSFNISQEQYNAMSQTDAAKYDAALEALSADQDAVYAYNLMIQLVLLITSMSALLSHLALEFAVPLFLKNGQTLGKKIFGIALMRPDCVRVNAISLFIRTLLGKYTIEVMIPLLMVMMMFLGTIGIVGPIVVGGIGLLQVILLATSRNHTAIHDYLANTVAVDLQSQMIFDTEEALIAYKKKLHAEKAANQVY